MESLWKLEAYQKELADVATLPLPWEKLKDKTVLLTGATGLIGTFLSDVLRYRNEHLSWNTKIFAVSRHAAAAREAFEPIRWDVNEPLERQDVHPDFIVHAASNTHPLQYAADSVGSLLTNLLGTRHLLELARQSGTERVVFLSSVEIYGQALSEKQIFSEETCGFIDCNQVRACYPEGKRAGEALCQAYRSQYGLDIVLPRLSRTYGPTMKLDDSKAMSQFLKNGVRGEDIVLKSEGLQRYSYCYVKDAVAGILYAWLVGQDGEAYNVSDDMEEVISLRQIAQIIASASGTRVVFDLPDEKEAKGFSKVTTCVMSNTKLHALGWRPMDTLATGLEKTLRLLRHRCSRA